MYELILAAAALVPAIVLLVYINKKDRCEKEPPSLIFRLFISGVIACFPAIELEVFFSALFESVGLTEGLLYNLADAFVGVALVEEGVKWIAMFAITARNRHFNSLFDGMVYAVSVSLGFAAVENIFYCFDGGLSVALVRSMTSIPGHMFFGVFMGYFYSIWHINSVAAAEERRLANAGVVPRGKRRFFTLPYLLLSIAVPILLHGFYDICLFVESDLSVLVFTVFLVLLYLFSFARINKLSKRDGLYSGMVVSMLSESYPESAYEIERFYSISGMPQSFGAVNARQMPPEGYAFVYADASGYIMQYSVAVGYNVFAGQRLMYISDSFGNVIQTVTSPVSGRVVSIGYAPGTSVNRNMVLMVISLF